MSFSNAPTMKSESDSDSLSLSLEITDKEVIQDLLLYPEGTSRQTFALTALRLGVVSLRYASGQLDSTTIKQAGDELLGEVRQILLSRSTELNHQLSTALTQYFDPTTGLLSQRLQALVQKDGELERIMTTQIGADDSILVKSLTRYIGADSPLFTLLSPTEQGGLRAQIGKVVEEALVEQKTQILKEFTLDNKDSALCRMIAELSLNQATLTGDVRGQLDIAMKEFSLDQPNSALSRLVQRVEAAQKSINEQFSIESETSAINKIIYLLQSTNKQIADSLTLDNESSALARMKREIQTILVEMVQSNTQFQADVRVSLTALHTRRQEEQRSTRHGEVFEDDLGALLSIESQRLNDIHQTTGSSTGAIRNCKTGDHLIILGPESSAPSARIIWEAKEDKSYGLKDALVEIEQARKNRLAQIGVFVFSSKTAPQNMLPFARYGADLIVVWNAEDPNSDIYVRAAYSVSRALSVKHNDGTKESDEAILEIELAARQIEKQIQYLDDFKKWGDTIKGHGEKIAERADRIKKELVSEVSKLDKQLVSLKASRQLTPDDFAF